MIGIDIIEIARVKKAAENPRFLTRVYTPREREYIKSKNSAPQTIAGLFAAKEAVAKALGTGFSAFAFRDIEITHSASGAPSARIKTAPSLKIELSISHCKTYACAAAMTV